MKVLEPGFEILPEREKELFETWLALQKEYGYKGAFDDRYWRWVHAFYENSIVMTITISCAFWFIEFPAQGVTRATANTHPGMVIFLLVDHTLPLFL
jgi:hypothetical protein